MAVRHSVTTAAAEDLVAFVFWAPRSVAVDTSMDTAVQTDAMRGWNVRVARITAPRSIKIQWDVYVKQNARIWQASDY